MMRVVFENRDDDGADDDIHKVVIYYVDFYCADVFDADVQNVDVIKGVHDGDHDDGKLNLMIRLVTPLTSTVMFLMRMFVRMLMLMMTVTAVMMMMTTTTMTIFTCKSLC